MTEFRSLSHAAFAVTALAFVLPSCKPTDKNTHQQQGEVSKTPAIIAANLNSNQMGQATTSLLRRQAASPVHWQLARPEVLADAKNARRIIFVCLVSSLQPESQKVLDELAASPALVETINDSYVPVLVDAQANREFALAANLLANEMRRPVSVPFFMWLSPEGNPIAWIPLQEKWVPTFENSDSMVKAVWKESYDYVLSNSREDAKLRAKRIAASLKPGGSETSAPNAGEIIRDLSTLYDEGSRQFDQSGGLFPAGMLECLALAATQESLSPSTREMAGKAARGASLRFLSSALVDPLEGGLYHSRRSQDFDLPNFQISTDTEARAIVALAACHRMGNMPEAKEAAEQFIRHLHEHCMTQDGWFIHSLSLNTGVENPGLWTTEEIEAKLSPEERKVFTAVTNISSLGNISLDSDPQRRCFRLNSLARTHKLADAAAKLSMPEVQLGEIYSSATRKLAKARIDRDGASLREEAIYLRTQCRVVSALCAAFTMTGQEAYRKEATTLFQRINKSFLTPDKSLVQILGASSYSATARALDYAVMIQASLDLYQITADPALVAGCNDWFGAISDRYLNHGTITELPAGTEWLQVPVVDTQMVFEESTIGLLYQNLQRFEKSGGKTPAAIREMLSKQFHPSWNQALPHTDAVLGVLAHQTFPRVKAPESAVTPEHRPAMGSALGNAGLRGTQLEVTPSDPMAVETANGKTPVENVQTLPTILSPKTS